MLANMRIRNYWNIRLFPASRPENDIFPSPSMKKMIREYFDVLKKKSKYGAVVVVDIHISYNNSALFLRRIPSGIPLPFFLELSQENSLRIKLSLSMLFFKNTILIRVFWWIRVPYKSRPTKSRL